MSIARVALDVPLPRLFDYAVPQGVSVAAGARVHVPFGRGRRVGVVVELAAASELDGEKVREILEVLTDGPPLPADWIELARFASDYYQRPLGEVMIGALPPRLREASALAAPITGYRLTALGREACGAFEACPETSKRRSVRTRVLAALASGVSSIESLTAVAPSAREALRRLAADGLIEADRSSIARDPALVRRYPLTPAQTSAIQAITATAGFAAYLLLGVTGSGKTEVYLHAIEAALRSGRQALVLVPEINLTPQLEAEFRERFPGAAVAIQHSALAANDRALTWLAVQQGEIDILLGTRLAVFAPFARLGLIIVDEEHESSFKQQDGVRYSARNLAVFRAHQRAIPIVLGSATPSLESYGNAKSGRYRLLELPARARAGARLPQVRMLDVRREKLSHGIAAGLVEAINARLARGEQSLVFLNRRGYAPVLVCGACGWTSGCERCAAHLVVHLADRVLRCHHCGLAARIPRGCPDCGNVDLVPFGRGTQRLEDNIRELFPQARALRIDSDSTRNRGVWERMRNSIREGEVDILLGTQILAKGHDFPNVTLVGVINADAALAAPDYRAPERLFAQLHQVAGRAGRGERPGEVLIQTRYPDHPLYQALARHDYIGFADAGLAERAQYGFPPSVAEAVLRAEAHDVESALRFLRGATSAAPAPPEEIRLFDPVAMSLARLAGWERAHVLVQSGSRRALQTYLAAWTRMLYAMRVPPDVRWHVDVDPLEF